MSLGSGSAATPTPVRSAVPALVRAGAGAGFGFHTGFGLTSLGDGQGLTCSASGDLLWVAGVEAGVAGFGRGVLDEAAAADAESRGASAVSSPGFELRPTITKTRITPAPTSIRRCATATTPPSHGREECQGGSPISPETMLSVTGGSGRPFDQRHRQRAASQAGGRTRRRRTPLPVARWAHRRARVGGVRGVVAQALPVGRLWRNAWEQFVPCWTIRRRDPNRCCARRTIESLNARYRGAVTVRGHFPTEQAAMKCLCFVTRSLDSRAPGSRDGPCVGRQRSTRTRLSPLCSRQGTCAHTGCSSTGISGLGCVTRPPMNVALGTSMGKLRRD